MYIGHTNVAAPTAIPLSILKKMNIEKVEDQPVPNPDNNLNGKEISKETLTRFHVALKKDIDSRRIDAHVNYGVDCITIEKRIARALKKMNSTHRIANCKAIHIAKPNLLITQTARGPEVVRAKKAVHDHHSSKPVPKTSFLKPFTKIYNHHLYLVA